MSVTFTSRNKMKPKTAEAMSQLLCEIRKALPLDRSDILLCRRVCIGCPKKLIQYLRREVEDWEWALAQGDQPSLGDISSLAKTSRKIYKALEKNGLVAS
ncbi:hypothetical protein SAMN02745866_01445 [Alteromonadaceae bacterium Bs31]|nr:hypothetical protein SAMN02745866_01445 [Alteromonadaceae bacterium Bs31]